jgi:hypothetical protein
MNISISDFMVHVGELLPAQAMARLENDIRGEPGVISAQFSRRAPHLMMVALNPELSSSTAILNRVASKGLQARLVGL